MELKYPRLSVGIKLMYVSWWCALIGAVVGFVGGMASAFAGVASGSLLVVSVLELAVMLVEFLVYGLQLAGLYKAAKDAKQYKKVFFMLVAELLIAVAAFAAVLSLNYVLMFGVGIIGGLICAVLEPLRLCLFVKYTEELVQENGDAGVKGYYKAIRNCIFVSLGGVIIGSIIAAAESLFWLGLVLIVVAMFSALAVLILYGIFLHNTNKFFKTLEKTDEADEEYFINI